MDVRLVRKELMNDQNQKTPYKWGCVVKGPTPNVSESRGGEGRGRKRIKDSFASTNSCKSKRPHKDFVYLLRRLVINPWLPTGRSNEIVLSQIIRKMDKSFRSFELFIWSVRKWKRKRKMKMGEPSSNCRVIHKLAIKSLNCRFD